MKTGRFGQVTERAAEPVAGGTADCYRVPIKKRLYSH
jgi:hypothetical protein